MLESVEVQHNKEVNVGKCEFSIQLNFQGDNCIGFCLEKGMTEIEVAKRIEKFARIMLEEYKF